MDENAAKANISIHFPNLKIKKIKKIGEGIGNLAYEVNTNLIFRFPKKQENRKQLGREISIQKILKKYSSLPFPEFIFIPRNLSFVGYRKLLGIPMLYKRDEFKDWGSLSQQLGHFLSKLHSVPEQELNELGLLPEKRSFEDWQKLGHAFFEKTKFLIPEHYLGPIEAFLSSEPPKSVGNLVFCHNDLGLEHILVVKSKVTGIIDWGGVLADPACDFARLYRDIGEKVLDTVLAEYTDIQVVKNELRQRAIFYGKCLFFEDLYYGYGLEQKEYRQKALAALEWMF